MSVWKAACLVLCLTTAVQPCCLPAEWEAGFSTAMISLDGEGANKQFALTNSYGRASVDGTNQIVVLDQEVIGDGRSYKLKMILDYSKRAVFSITADGCSRDNFGGSTLVTCIPSNSSRNDFQYGIGNNTLDAKGYHFQIPGNEIYMTVTRDTCVPIAAYVTFKAGGMANDIVFKDVTTGIKDRGVFNVPSDCGSR